MGLGCKWSFLMNKLANIIITASLICLFGQAQQVYAANNVVRFTEEANKTENWLFGTTKRFDLYEQFFIKNDIRPTYRSGYVYDIKQEKILSGEEALNLFPKLIVRPDTPAVKLSKQELTHFVNIALPQNNDSFIYIYLDVPTLKNGNYIFSADDSMVAFLEKSMARRKEAAAKAKDYRNLVAYLVSIPHIGSKSQY